MISKVIYDGSTLMDITDSTVEADKMDSGTIAYDKSGTKITGTRKPYVDVFSTAFTMDGSNTGQWWRDVYPTFDEDGYVEFSISNWTEDTTEEPLLLSLGTNIDTFSTAENGENYYIHIFSKDNSSLEFDVSTGSGYKTSSVNQIYTKTTTANPIIIRLDKEGMKLNGVSFTNEENSVIRQVANFHHLIVGERFAKYFPHCTYDYIRFR